MQRLLFPFAVGFLAALAATMSFSVLATGRAAALHFPADSLPLPEMETDADAAIPPLAATDTRDAVSRSVDALSMTPPAASIEQPNAALSLRRDSTTVVHERRLARTFGAMGAKDAARVLEQMSDADIATVLSYLNERQAGGILANITPARVARLGERVLRNSGSNASLEPGME